MTGAAAASALYENEYSIFVEIPRADLLKLYGNLLAFHLSECLIEQLAAMAMIRAAP
jgi:hypothetical protein